ncbi:hypothetical protein X801_02626, partial [Opisthorchis viverrini]
PNHPSQVPFILLVSKFFHVRMELLDLQHENEDLRARLQAATQAIDKKALEFIDLEKKLEEERGIMTCELEKLRERYDRLLSNHHRLSKINHELEARLLETIDAKNTEKKFLCDELEAAKSKLADCERRLSIVSAERNRYKDDCSVAVNLLQTNPDQFLPRNPKGQLPTLLWFRESWCYMSETAKHPFSCIRVQSLGPVLLKMECGIRQELTDPRDPI